MKASHLFGRDHKDVLARHNLSVLVFTNGGLVSAAIVDARHIENFEKALTRNDYEYATKLHEHTEVPFHTASSIALAFDGLKEKMREVEATEPWLRSVRLASIDINEGRPIKFVLDLFGESASDERGDKKLPLGVERSGTWLDFVTNILALEDDHLIALADKAFKRQDPAPVTRLINHMYASARTNPAMNTVDGYARITSAWKIMLSRRMIDPNVSLVTVIGAASYVKFFKPDVTQRLPPSDSGLHYLEGDKLRVNLRQVKPDNVSFEQIGFLDESCDPAERSLAHATNDWLQEDSERLKHTVLGWLDVVAHLDTPIPQFHPHPQENQCVELRCSIGTFIYKITIDL